MLISAPTPEGLAELFTIPLEDDRYLVYAPLHRAAFVANGRVVNLLADIKEGCFDPAEDPDGSLVELLRRIEILDAPPAQPPVTGFDGDPEPTSVTLFLTTACNLRCTYCYASAGDTPTKHMPLEVARRGIDFVAGNAAKKGLQGFEVLYHGGGEPAVNWRVLVDSFDYARGKAAALGIDVRGASASNGVLGDAQIDWIIANLHSVNISFDGLPSAHDKHRLTVLGQGSSHLVMHTIRRFDEAGFPYGLRVTVTRDQIAHLPDSIEFICANFRVESIQVEPAYQLGRWASAPSAETDEFIAAYREAQARAHARDRAISYSAARVGLLTNHFCGVSQDTFALSPDGNVSSCYEVFSEDNSWAKFFFYGAPEPESGKYRFNLPVLNKLRGLSVEHREFCRGCFARWSCAGDCFHKALTINGEGEFQGSDRCHITRELTKDQILEKIALSGGLFWHEGRPVDEHAVAKGKEVFV
ncbi:MAG: radical SAM protein [Acidobacteria bacterium]|nr:radical SAM protein [Acidobacteriota bacterium]MCW5969906.1 radical SAM protein [Blastocatellales bacterium]